MTSISRLLLFFPAVAVAIGVVAVIDSLVPAAIFQPEPHQLSEWVAVAVGYATLYGLLAVPGCLVTWTLRPRLAMEFAAHAGRSTALGGLLGLLTAGAIVMINLAGTVNPVPHALGAGVIAAGIGAVFAWLDWLVDQRLGRRPRDGGVAQ